MTDIDADGLADLLAELVARETVNPPGDEGVLAEYLVERLDDSPVDFDVGVREVHPGRPNVVARAGDPEKGSLLLTGHMDVVPANPDDWTADPFELRREGDRLVGRGTADMKGALAAKLLAAEAFLASHDDPGEVILGFTVDEERGGSGTEALAERVEADAAIIGEPSRCQVAIAEYGVVGYELTVRGESGHSGRPDRAVNAVDGLRKALDRVEALDDEVRTQEHDLLEPGPSVSITEIDGGLAPNVIPDEATATVFWRTLPDIDRDPAVFDDRLADALEGVTLDGEPVDVEFERWLFSAGSEVDRDAAIVRETLDAAREVGIDAEVTGFNAGTDARFLTRAGIPTLVFGPGSIEDDAHTVDESVALDELVATAETYRGVLERRLG
ncbi:M20 family metallopeptidase (plasmid) [Halorussus salilacus]|uniref:M20 family metallopeptidase n=1 Tax=Halorussus salilacus TaxID=2953750 RepID=UPI0020A208B3|nr:M20 family metallopeptidase [Halorussus salilacus]USZ69905.1 M20 family metallopeptidase [Halorussus salilacus]